MDTALLLDYRGRDPEEYINMVLAPVIAPLQGFSQLRIFVHAENIALRKRQEKEKHWQSVIKEWQVQTKPKVTLEVFYDVYGTPTGPCVDWFKNMWLAFQDAEVERIVYLPFDIAFMDPPATSDVAHKGLQEFINAANQGDIDLLLGTYEAETEIAGARNDTFLIPLERAGTAPRRDIRKNLLEEFTVVELWSAFPKSMAWFCQQRNDPQHKPVPRTGFFGLSKRLFQEFINRPRRPTMLPWAGTVQLLLCAVIRTREGRQNYKVAERLVTKLKQAPESFTGYGLAHQRERIAYVIADERHYWSRELPELEL